MVGISLSELEVKRDLKGVGRVGSMSELLQLLPINGFVVDGKKHHLHCTVSWLQLEGKVLILIISGGEKKARGILKRPQILTKCKGRKSSQRLLT